MLKNFTYKGESLFMQLLCFKKTYDVLRKSLKAEV